MNHSYVYHLVGPVDQFPERLGRVVRIGGHELAVFHTTQGQLYALANKSPGPKGGTIVEGIVSGEVLFDPICDWKINLADGQVFAPDSGQVRSYPVKVEDGQVSIAVPIAEEEPEEE